MDQVYPVVIVFVLMLVAVVVILQMQIRRQYRLKSSMSPEGALQAISRAVGGGQAYVDAGGDLAVPFRNGICSIAITPSDDGIELHVWLSQYPFLAANGFQVLGYKSLMRRIQRATAGSLLAR
jgi:hypothetical protein